MNWFFGKPLRLILWTSIVAVLALAVSSFFGAIYVIVNGDYVNYLILCTILMGAWFAFSIWFAVEMELIFTERGD
jgi:hypothetical protein